MELSSLDRPTKAVELDKPVSLNLQTLIFTMDLGFFEKALLTSTLTVVFSSTRPNRRFNPHIGFEQKEL